MPEQLTLTLDPVVGSLVTIDEACHIDGSRYTLSWRSDNKARVGLREQDCTGMVRCNRAGTCQVAECCLFGKPHRARDEDDGSTMCYDHRPYVVGGVKVWAKAMS